MNQAAHDWISLLGVLEQDFQPPTLDGLTAAAACMAVSQAADDLIAKSTAVSAFFDSQPKGPGASVPPSPSVELANFLGHRRAEIDQSDPRVWSDFIGTFMIPVFRFRQRQVLRLLASRPEWAAYRSIIERGQEVAAAVDDLWLAWFRRLALPYGKLTVAGRQAAAASWKPVLSEFDYTCFRDALPDCPDRMAWAQAFASEIERVRASLGGLRAVMPDSATQRYLDRLSRAYGTADIAKLETAWAEVDRVWIEITADSPFIPVHGMENGYEHPYGVSPEFRLSWRVTAPADAELIESFRVGTAAYAQRHPVLAPEAVADVHRKLAKLDIGVFFPVVESGVCLNSRIGGQVVPNRQDVLALGGKIFISDDAAEQNAVDLYRGSARKHFAAETADRLVPAIMVRSMKRHTVSHECFHPVGCSPAIDSRLGVSKGLLEETKASLGGLLVGREVDRTPEADLETVAVCAARTLRFVLKSRMSDLSVAAYVRENLVVLKTMLDTGLLRLGPDGLVVDLDQARVDSWFDQVRVFIDRTLAAYRAGDAAVIERLHVEYCGADDLGANQAVADVISWVNRIAVDSH